MYLPHIIDVLILIWFWVRLRIKFALDKYANKILIVPLNLRNNITRLVDLLRKECTYAIVTSIHYRYKQRNHKIGGKCILQLLSRDFANFISSHFDRLSICICQKNYLKSCLFKFCQLPNKFNHMQLLLHLFIPAIFMLTLPVAKGNI